MNTRLKVMIIQQGTKQCAVAKEIGITPQVFSHYVNEWIKPSDEVKTKIAAILECEVGDIFDAKKE